jgi:hypothetical protein
VPDASPSNLTGLTGLPPGRGGVSTAVGRVGVPVGSGGGSGSNDGGVAGGGGGGGGGGGRGLRPAPGPTPDARSTLWLNFGDIFHKLSFVVDERCVYVTIYRPKSDKGTMRSAAISYSVCPEFESSWVSKTTVFEIASLSFYRWNKNDTLVAEGFSGTQEEVNQLRFWRVR